MGRNKFEVLEREIRNIVKNSPIPTDPSHSENTRKWVMKLKPDASNELQIAALTHDIERGKRIEKPNFENYRDYKNWHSKRSARIITEVMKKHGIDENSIKKVKNLVLNHEVGGNEDQNILRHADSLSFFENNIEYYYSSRGEDRTRLKIRYMYDRCSEKVKGMIREMDFPEEIKGLVKSEIG